MMIDAQLPTDHPVRVRFSHEVDTSFSLLAPAGSGKTRAISDRVAMLAQCSNAVDRLPRLVAVTYTNKAADELRQRASSAIRAAGCPERVQHAFERSFFGTIHSFASHLLREVGHFIGVPAGFEGAPDVDVLWKRFLQSVGAVNDGEVAARVLRHIPFADVRVASEGCSAGRPVPAPRTSVPTLDLDQVLAYVPKRKQSLGTVARGQRQIRAFAELWHTSGNGFAALPQISQGGAEFMAMCNQALAPASEWLRAGVAHMAGTLAAEFRAWRVAQGLLTYDDQVSLAAELFKNEDAARAIRERGFCVVLDEAQDTDPAQFTVLLECTRPVDCKGAWWEDGATPPAPGRFVMVGDFQQAIYSSRADLETCRRAHALISRPGVGEALTFTTTFRCDADVLDFVNRVGPEVLDGGGRQVSYVPLQTRAGAGRGQTLRLPVSADEIAPDASAEAVLFAEGRTIGHFLRTQGLAGLGITAWNQVAVLAPRTAWLGTLRQGLLSEGVRSVVLSQSGRNCDRPAYIWSAAVATVLTEQRNSWEIVGVLRDVFGLSDAELAAYSKGDGERFHLDAPHDGPDEVDASLRDLAELRRSIHTLPLRDAFEQIDRQLLRPRLRALPVDRYGDTDSMLDEIGAIAARIEGEGGDLATFALHLREHYYDKTEAQGDDPAAVCLLTNHKSKGLEWSVVILPTLFREFSFENPSYPRVIGGISDPIDVAFSKEEATTHDTNAFARCTEEIARLLYVSLTRAKNLLVLCDDRDLWASESVPDLSLAKALRLDCRPEWMSTLSDQRAPAGGKPSARRAPLNHPFVVDLAKAAKIAAKAPQKITPHRLASDHDHEGVEARRDDRTRALPYVATHYGTWWHETMRRIPWCNHAAWQPTFDEHLASCPDTERAQGEWALFLGSALAERLKQAEIVRTECPFLVPVGNDSIEGVIDLVFRHNGAVGWLVVDWKTSQTHTPEGAAADYGPQLRPYRDVVAGKLAQQVTALIYLTHIGEEVLVA